MAPIRVIICDDHVLYRAGVKTALNSKKDIKVIAEADNGLHLLNILKNISVDVILLDIQMPVMDGITTLPEIKRIYPGIKVVMLTMMDDNSMVSALMGMGANSYLTKTSDSEIIYEAIVTVFKQDYYFTPLINKSLFAKPHHRSIEFTREEIAILKRIAKKTRVKNIAVQIGIADKRLNGIIKKLKEKTGTTSISGLITYINEHKQLFSDVILNEKEITILRFMCEEKSSKEIADAMDLSPRTVEAIREKLKNKTGAKSTAGLIMYAVKHNLISDRDNEIVVLNDDEKLLLKLTYEEKSEKEIAKKLKMDVDTIVAMKERLMSKTATKSIVGLVNHAIKNKLINP